MAWKGILSKYERKFQVSSFGAGVLAGGIIITVGNIPVIMEGGAVFGFLVGVAAIVVGTIVCIRTKKIIVKKEENEDVTEESKKD